MVKQMNMRSGTRSLWKEEKGVSVVIGAILMLLLVAGVWGIMQAINVPLWNKDVEYEHLNEVHDDMITFKSDVEDVASSRAPKSSDFRMGVHYPNRMFLANPGTGVAGSLTSENVAVSIVGNPSFTHSYTSNRIIYEVRGSIDSPRLVYEHGIIIRDYGNEQATADEQPLIVGDEIYLPVLIGDLTAGSSMETGSIMLKPLTQSSSLTNIESVTITLDTNYPTIWEQLLAGTSTTATTVQVLNGQIIIHSTAVRQITFPEGTAVTDALYAGVTRLSTTPVSQSSAAFIIGGGTGNENLQANSTHYVPMFNSNRSTVESENWQFMSGAGTLSNFYVTLSGSPGANHWYTFVVRKNGSDSTVTCSISEANITASDLIHTVTFSTGDRISIQVTPSASNPTARLMLWTALFTQ